MQQSIQSPDEFTRSPAFLPVADALDYIWGEASPPLAHVPLDDPPPGEVRLIDPVPIPDDPAAAQWLEDELWNRRAVLEELLVARNAIVLRERQIQFSYFTCRLLQQRFRLLDLLSHPDGQSGDPESIEHLWLGRLMTEEVMGQALKIYDQYGDVVLVTDLRGFELQPPRRRIRTTNGMAVSLRPVFEALAVFGLWVGTDEQFKEVARTIIAIAQRQGGGQ